jgi:hypothetical protein
MERFCTWKAIVDFMLLLGMYAISLRTSTTYTYAGSEQQQLAGYQLR